MKSSQKPISLYIHWPYCLSKCPYCDFASTACSAVDEEILWPGYARDLMELPAERPVQTIFLGGGTPSLMSPRFLERLLRAVESRTTLASDCEITIEANPDAIDKDKMQAFRALGVNRLSLGVQALNAADLRFLGRRHTVQTAMRRIEEAQSVFDRINIDLIYARPNQTGNSWQAELEQALRLGLTHYSLYQLTIEEQTVFGRRGISAADEEQAAVLYCLTDQVMAAAGLPAYEVSNYARPGQECRHNLTYWRGGDYVGVGPAAHGRIGQIATQNPRTVRAWLDQGTQTETLTPEQKELERILMGLRLRQEWLSLGQIDPRRVRQAIQNGWLEQSERGIRPTLAGILVLNHLILTLI